jgi:hypothetical protein
MVRLACALAPAHAEKRVALVIGNDRYANLPDREQLRKAVSDARAVGAALWQIGFDVISGEDLGRGALVDKLDELTRRSRDRQHHLRRANLGVEKLRFLLRLAMDLKLLNGKRHEHAARALGVRLGSPVERQAPPVSRYSSLDEI